MRFPLTISLPVASLSKLPNDNSRSRCGRWRRWGCQLWSQGRDLRLSKGTAPLMAEAFGMTSGFLSVCRIFLPFIGASASWIGGLAVRRAVGFVSLIFAFWICLCLFLFVSCYLVYFGFLVCLSPLLGLPPLPSLFPSQIPVIYIWVHLECIVYIYVTSLVWIFMQASCTTMARVRRWGGGGSRRGMERGSRGCRREIGRREGNQGEVW